LVRSNFLNNLFPPKYNFYSMLREQAEITARGINTLLIWLEDFSPESYDLLRDLASQADNVRMNMEEKLIEAFTTPFDRQDIYYISVQMDRIIEYGSYALQSVVEFAIVPDETIIEIVNELNMGMLEFSKAVDLLEKNPGLSQKKIEKMRKAQKAIDNLYIKGMASLFESSDPITTMKYHEVYSQLKEASIHLGYTVDILHRIVVRLI
jgi:uncharacterized protein Yka (UPF0111/DUF47 family)